MDMMHSVAAHFHPSLPVAADSDALPAVHGQVTVVEVAAAFAGSEPTERELSDAFDRGLDLIRALQRAYYLETQDAISLVAREQLPTTILVVTEREGSARSGVFFTHDVSIRRTMIPEELSDNRLNRLAGILRAMVPGDPFWPYADLRREALAALWLRGDYRAAVLGAATAAEVLLDTLLLHLFWVEGAKPEVAAALLEESGVTARVKSQYASRIGGKWNLAGGDPVSEWHSATAAMRNRVAHAGHEPSLDEARAAIQGTLRLEVHLMDLVCTPPRLQKYIKTALAITGIPGIEKRGRMSRRIRELIDATPQADLDLFHHWRDEVVIARAK
ncbi:hypothetical protein [Agromyces sp. SYSU T0242]|uniref:hypothetical protein n=1 Tax=Agromyces litoreus TaxID=3158561 RepID=UPI0033932F3E